MRAIFKTFESGAGDCLFLILKDDQIGDSFHIMVDCNVLTPEIKHFIYSELGSKIDCKTFARHRIRTLTNQSDSV